MKPADLLSLLSLAGLWGASYVFMRLGAGEFGAIALAGVRAAGAALILLALLGARGGLAGLRTHWKPIAVVGLTNSALPYALFSFAALTLPSGVSAIITATTPMFAALIAWLWLKDRLTPTRMLGLAIGFAGVLWLVWDKIGFAGADGAATGWAALACLAATLLYGLSANFSKRFLSDVPSLTVAAGSQLSSALVLAGPAVWLWPATPPSAQAWGAAAALVVACTAVAYVLFFALIARIGASRAMTALFMIPAFGVLWGTLFLGEAFTVGMALGVAVILAGTALATGLMTPHRVPKAIHVFGRHSPLLRSNC
jgi:drug/metabolite transporter (DMT)-like permease